MVVGASISELVTTVTTNPDSVTTGSNRTKALQSKNYSHSVTTVTTIPSNKILNKGDRLKFVGNDSLLPIDNSLDSEADGKRLV